MLVHIWICCGVDGTDALVSVKLYVQVKDGGFGIGQLE